LAYPPILRSRSCLPSTTANAPSWKPCARTPKRLPPHRRAGRLHPRPCCAGIRLGRAGNHGGRWSGQPQSVRHQGRQQLAGCERGDADHRIPPGLPLKVAQRFRAYADYGEAFSDYAGLLKSRYAAALESGDAGSFAAGLAAGGYASDPAYAGKLKSVIASVALAGA